MSFKLRKGTLSLGRIYILSALYPSFCQVAFCFLLLLLQLCNEPPFRLDSLCNFVVLNHRLHPRQ